MDMKIFVDALTLDEMNQLSHFIHERRVVLAESLAKYNPLTNYQWELLRGGNYIQTIKAYRDFYNASLFVAKTVVDAARASLAQDRAQDKLETK